MALTGTGISLNSDRFGGVESYARGAASDGTTAYHFGRTQGYTLDVSTGDATASGSAWSGSGTIRGATYHNSQVLVYIDSRNIHVWTPGTGFGATAEISNLRYATGSGFSGDPSINGFASHDGVLYVADGNEDHLFSVGTDGVLTAIGSGFGNISIGGMTSHDGQLLGTDNTNDRLVVIDTSTGTTTDVANNALPGTRTVDFLLSHGDELYGGQFSDGLMRFYDVAWDATIADFEVDEGESATIDLDAISRDADSFSITSPPSWLSVSGTDLVVTNAPAVDADTDNEITLLATRDGVSDTLTHNIVVRNTLATTLSIEAIDEQFITIGTEDYDLEIDIGGDPDKAWVEGLQEGFYQDWDATNDRLHIKAEEVQRLTVGAIWTVYAEKGTDQINSEITYNVVPAAPILTDPGAQTLYKGIRFSLQVGVTNEPSIARGESQLVGLVSTPGIDADGNAVILTEGVLPRDANLADSTFDAEYYVENDAGNDMLTVPFTVEDIPNYLGIYLRTSGSSGLWVRVLNLDDSNSQIGSDIGAGTSINPNEKYFVLWGRRFAVIEPFRTVKVYEIDNTITQAGDDIDFSTNVRRIDMYENFLGVINSATDADIRIYDMDNMNAEVGAGIDSDLTLLAISRRYVAAAHSGSLKIYDLQTGSQRGNTVTLTQSATDIVMTDNYLAVYTNDTDTVEIYDPSDSSNVQQGDDISLGTGFFRIAVSGNYLVAAGFNGTDAMLKIFNLSDENYSQVGSDISLGTHPSGSFAFVAISNNLVAVGINRFNQTDFVRIFDIDNNNAQVGSDIAIPSNRELIGVSMTKF